MSVEAVEAINHVARSLEGVGIALMVIALVLAFKRMA